MVIESITSKSPYFKSVISMYEPHIGNKFVGHSNANVICHADCCKSFSKQRLLLCLKCWCNHKSLLTLDVPTSEEMLFE